MRPTPLAAILIAQLILSPALTAQTARSTPAADTPATLPVTHVSLYKNGIGFFEHTGHVTGNAQVSIDFTSSQLNDVLQSLTAIDLNGGRISGAGYNSTKPLEQQLRTLPLALDSNPTIQAFYASIRGSRVEINTGNATITGRLLSVETGDTIAPPHTTSSPSDDNLQRLLLTVVSDSGEVRTIPITTATTVHLLDAALDANVGRYLKLLDSNRSQGLRHLTLDDNGSGSRELRVSYISEVPIWKSTYRILFSDSAMNAGGPSSTPGGPSFASSAKGGVSSGTNSGATTATLQGWSVVDNTTGTDWINVHLSLIAGAPQSFIQPLSQPIYSRRPEIPIAQEAQLAPQTFESGDLRGEPGSGLTGTVTDPSGAIIPNASITATNTATGATQKATSDSSGRFSMPVAAGTYRVEASISGFQHLIEQGVNVDGQHLASVNLPMQVGSVSQSVEVSASSPMLMTESASVSSLPINGRNIAMARKVANSYASPLASPKAPAPPPPPRSYEDIANTSFTANTQNNAFDDFFAYNVADPITIHKNESALVPILQSKINAERVTLVHSNGGAISQPLRALWIDNTTGQTLDRGSFSIVEDGNFGGEGLLDPIHPSEKRLLSYAADQAIHVSTEGTGGTNHIVRVTAANGVLTFEHAEHTQLTYVIRNAAADQRTIILEHPIRQGYTLDASLKPEETTPTLYRFRVHAAPGETVRLPISANHQGFTTYELTSSDESQLAYILQQSGNDPKLAAALAPILEARRQVAATDAAVDQTQTTLDNLHSNEDRQRANITALNNADKASRDRFVNDLNHTEDQIVATQKEMDTRTAAKEAAEAHLSTLIENLQLNEPL